MATLHAARLAGLHVFVAIAPTYPECDEADLRVTLTAVAELDPITVFPEPINIRADNVQRIEHHADNRGVVLHTDVFQTRNPWQAYAVNALHTIEWLAGERGIANHLHLWPDKSLGSPASAKHFPDPERQQSWLNRGWTRISECPPTSVSR